MVSVRGVSAGARAPLWRRLLAMLAIVVCCLSAPLAVFAGWTQFVLSDPAAYQNMVQSLAFDPAVQSAVVNAAADSARVQRAPRPVLAAATPATGAATPVALAAATPVAVGPGEALPANLLAEAATSVVRSEQFADVWRESNAAIHREVFAPGAGPAAPLTLDLSRLGPGIQQYLDTLGIPGLEPVQLSTGALRITLLDAPAEERLQRLVDRLEAKTGVLIAIAVLALVAAIALAPSRLIALRRLGAGVVVTTIVFLLALLLGQTVVAGRLQNPLATPVVLAVLDAVLTQPVLWELGLVVAGLLLAILAGLLRWASTR